MKRKVQVAVYQKEKEGSSYCGDSYFFKETEDGFICALADGLGSGEFAEESAEIVIDIIKKNTNASQEEIVKKCNEQLLGKRGVVLGILKLNFNASEYSVSSIGNIGIVLVTSDKKKRRYIPSAGYLAGFKRAFKIERGKLENQMNFIMFSDGVRDVDLAPCMYHQNVDEIIKAYECASHDKLKNDDTTLMAIRYVE